MRSMRSHLRKYVMTNSMLVPCTFKQQQAHHGSQHIDTVGAQVYMWSTQGGGGQVRAGCAATGTRMQSQTLCWYPAQQLTSSTKDNTNEQVTQGKALKGRPTCVRLMRSHLRKYVTTSTMLVPAHPSSSRHAVVASISERVRARVYVV